MKAMTRRPDAGRQMKIALRVGTVAASVVLVCTVVLVADHVLTIRRTPADDSRIEGLEEQVKIDAAIAEQLHAERDLLRDVSLARKSRNRVLAWVLVVAGGLVVACGKRYVALRPQRSPDLDKLVAVRFAPAMSGNGKRPERAGTPAPAADGDIDLSFVDDLVARSGRSREAAIPILQAIQTHYRYLPGEALARVCELTDITAAQITGTSSFYAQFRRSPVGRHVVRVCHGTACHVAGAERITEELRRHLEIPDGADTDPRRLFTIDRVACVGCCSLAPVMMIEEATAGRLTPASARQALDALEPGS
jgi:NADH:ubiquinone oxidoreductase subunit E